MTRTRRSQSDPIEHEIELALNPGAFIPYGASFSLVSDLDDYGFCYRLDMDAAKTRWSAKAWRTQ